MQPFVTLAQSTSPQGAVLTLHSHDTHFYLRVNGQPLMGTNEVESEKTLASLACERLGAHRVPRVLIGGLGFGFSLRRVLECVGKEAIVDVAELLPEVVAWNREYLGAVNGMLLDDPRVHVTTADVFQMMTQAPAAHYEAILLDVDNGPIAMVQGGNARLYQDQGLDAIKHALKPSGKVTFWSATADPAFVKRLVKAGFKADAVAAKSHPHAKRAAHTIIVASRALRH